MGTLDQHPVPMLRRPPYYKGSEAAAIYSSKDFSHNDEAILTVRLVMDRQHFGRCYRLLAPELFEAMDVSSGVMVAWLIPSEKLLPGMSYPGDIDLLIIPYSSGNLLLAETLAVEVKVVRASFKKQGKSPNQFGMSQASSMLAHGFPNVAVLHLVVSDKSPPSAWREVAITEIINASTGEVAPLRSISTDMMPIDLLRRSYGRMKANCKNSKIGLTACYIGGEGRWHPEGRKAKRNPRTNPATLEAIANYFHANTQNFFDTPKQDP